jgi:hypothetical protein
MASSRRVLSSPGKMAKGVASCKGVTLGVALNLTLSVEPAISNPGLKLGSF